jgi:chaperonin GroES
MPELTRIIPAPQKLAIEPMPEQDRTSSGIWLMNNPNEAKPIIGTVTAVCRDYELEGQPFFPLYKEGDIVVIGKYSGTELQLGRKKVIILHERDVLCRLEPEEPASEDSKGATQSLSISR